MSKIHDFQNDFHNICIKKKKSQVPHDWCIEIRQPIVECEMEKEIPNRPMMPSPSLNLKQNEINKMLQ